jgi:hypothetical protein
MEKSRSREGDSESSEEENMERPAPDCKGRRDLINRCVRQGGMWPPLVADYPVGTEPHTMKGAGLRRSKRPQVILMLFITAGPKPEGRRLTG